MVFIRGEGILSDGKEPYKEEIAQLLNLAKFAMLCCLIAGGYLGAESLGLGI